MEPYDYTLNLQNPLASFQSTYLLGSGIRQQREAAMAEEQRKLQEQAMAQAEARRQELLMQAYDRLRKPEAKARDYENLAMLLPKDQAETLLAVAKNRTEEENTADLVDSMSVFNSFNAGLPEMGIKLLRQHSEAARNSNDEAAAQKLEELATIAESGPDGAKAVENMLGLTIIGLPKGKDALDAATKFNDERRKAIEHPVLVEQKKAELDKAKSEADKSRVEADYSERFKVAELEDKAAELGLTGAQKNEAIARTKKLDAETAKLLLELEAQKKTGGVDPEKKFEQEAKIRGEYQKRISNFNEMTQTMQNIKASAADSSGAGDVALVTGFMKMLDPGSVVRESEFATARDTAGLYGSLQSVAKKVQNGQFLTPQQRKDFAGLAEKYMQASSGYEIKVRKDLSKVVDSYGLSSDNIFGVQPEEKQEEKPKTTPKQATMYRNEADALSAASRQTGSGRTVQVDF